MAVRVTTQAMFLICVATALLTYITLNSLLRIPSRLRDFPSLVTQDAFLRVTIRVSQLG